MVFFVVGGRGDWKKFSVCGYIHEGDEAPEQCPVCKVGKDKFVEIVEQEGDLQFVTEHKLHFPFLFRLFSILIT